MNAAALDLAAADAALTAIHKGGAPLDAICARLGTTEGELGAVLRGEREPPPDLAQRLGHVVTFDTLPEGNVVAFPVRDRLMVDGEQIERFTNLLFRHAHPGHFISLRAFDDTRGDLPPFAVQPVKADATAPGAAAELAQRCADDPASIVFCPPVATFRTADAATEANIAEGLAISIEIDKDPAGARERLERLLGPATVVVASGGEWPDPATGEIVPKLHLHWRLAEPTRDAAGHAMLKEARKHATQLAGADATNVPPGHPIRWPGSWHRKSAPRLCHIIAENEGAEISLADAFAALCAETGADATPPAESRKKPIGDPPSPKMVEAVKDALRTLGNKTDTYAEWMRRVAAIKAALGGLEEHYPIYEEWCLEWAGNTPELARKKWQSVTHSTVGANYIFDMARAEAGWKGAGFEFEPVRPRENASQAPGKLNFRQLPTAFDPRAIPRRPFVLGTRLLRGAASLGLGAPGVSKSTLVISSALALLTGRDDLTGEPVRQRGNVLLYNAEDPVDELERRIGGICKHYGINFEDIRPGLFYSSGQDAPLILARKHRDGDVRPEEGAVNGLIQFIRDNEIVAAFLDPLVGLHRGVAENSNEEIEAVLAVVRRIAHDGNCAVDLTHHTTKAGASAKDGGAGDPNVGRGASSLTGAVRVAYTITAADEKTAQKLRLSKAVAARLIRLDRAKGNYSPRDRATQWFEITSVDIGNGASRAAADFAAQVFDQPGEPSDTVGVPVMFDMENAERAATQQDAREEEADAATLADVIARAMPSDKCSLKSVLAAVMAHAKCEGTKARDLLRNAVPDSAPGRAATVDGRACVLLRVREGDWDKAPVKLMREWANDGEGN